MADLPINVPSNDLLFSVCTSCATKPHPLTCVERSYLTQGTVSRCRAFYPSSLSDVALWCIAASSSGLLVDSGHLGRLITCCGSGVSTADVASSVPRPYQLAALRPGVENDRSFCYSSSLCFVCRTSSAALPASYACSIFGESIGFFSRALISHELLALHQKNPRDIMLNPKHFDSIVFAILRASILQAHSSRHRMLCSLELSPRL